MDDSSLFLNNGLSENVYNKTINRPWHDSTLFSVCEINFNFTNIKVKYFFPWQKNV